MGEIADMMLDGTMCQVCGEWMNCGEDGPGYPLTCAGCGGDDDAPRAETARRTARDTACSTCGRKFRGRLGLEMHRVAKEH